MMPPWLLRTLWLKFLKPWPIKLQHTFNRTISVRSLPWINTYSISGEPSNRASKNRRQCKAIFQIPKRCVIIFELLSLSFFPFLSSCPGSRAGTSAWNWPSEIHIFNFLLIQMNLYSDGSVCTKWFVTKINWKLIVFPWKEVVLSILIVNNTTCFYRYISKDWLKTNCFSTESLISLFHFTFSRRFVSTHAL